MLQDVGSWEKTLSQFLSGLGEVPANWKLANVTPIFKKGKKEEPRHYKPVSLTSVPGRVMEKISCSH